LILFKPAFLLLLSSAPTTRFAFLSSIKKLPLKAVELCTAAAIGLKYGGRHSLLS
jgi:hypothetical protein